MNRFSLVLRKINGSLVAGWQGRGGFIPGTAAALRAPSLLGVVGAFLLAIATPLLALLAVIAVLSAFGTSGAGIVLAAAPVAIVRDRTTRPERKDADPSTAGITSVKSAVEQLGRRFEEFKQANDERIAELKTRGSADATLVEKVEKLNAAITAVSDLKTRLEELETKAARPQLVDAKGRPIPKEQVEHKEAFAKFLRKGDEAGLAELEQKAMSVGSNPDGGYAVPVDIDRAIAALAVAVSPLRELAQVQPVSTPNYKKIVNKRGTGSGWVGETAARAATNTPQLEALTPFMGEFYAFPQTTQQILDDLFFDAEQWLAEEVAMENAYQEGVAFVSGDGVNKPKGFLAYATAATADGARAFGTIQHVVTGVAAALAASPNQADALLDMIYATKEAYRAGALFLMNSLTIAQFRKAKDTDGHYIWQPSTQAGQPDTVHGYGVRTAEAMPAIAANALPVAFANWKLAYQIVDRIGTRTLRDPFTNKPYVGFYTTKRTGGHVVNSEAIKVLKVSL
jgi:HK97 family phage major capsid protein